MAIRIPLDGKHYEAKSLYIKPSPSSSLYRVVKIVGYPVNSTKNTWYILKYPVTTSISNGSCSLTEYVFGESITTTIQPSSAEFTYPRTVTVTGYNSVGGTTIITYEYIPATGRLTITEAGAGTVSIRVSAVCSPVAPLTPPVITLSDGMVTITPGQGDPGDPGYYFLYAKKNGTEDEIVLATYITKNPTGGVTVDIADRLQTVISSLTAGLYDIYARQTLDGEVFSADSNIEQIQVNLLQLTVISATEILTKYVLIENVNRTISITNVAEGYALPEIIMIDNYVGTQQTQTIGMSTIWSWDSTTGSLTVKTSSDEINGRILCRTVTITAPEASLIKGVGNEDDSLYIVDTDGRAETYTVLIDGVSTGQTIIKS